MIVIGASLGGLRALSILLSSLPRAFSEPIAIVLHRAKDTEEVLRSVLQTRTSMKVVDVTDKDTIERGHVYLAPSDYHLLIDGDCFALSTDSPVNFARPSIDVLFESAADAWGAAAIAVILTGASVDGTAGAVCIAQRGGTVLVQDPETAESAIMPSSALKAIPRAQSLALTDISLLLARLTAPK